MEGTKKNPDNLNTIGIITVGGVGAALVYLSIVGLQAFYVDETAVVDEVRHFGDQEKVRTSLKAEQVGHNTDFVRKGAGANGAPMVTIGIDAAKALIVRDAKVDPSNLVPAVGKSDVSTIQPIFGRPVALPPAPVPPPADGTVPGVVPPDAAGAGAGTATPPDGAQPGTESQPAPVPGATTTPAGAAQPGAGSAAPAAGSAAPAPATPPARPTTPPAPATGSAPPPAAGGHQ